MQKHVQAFVLATILMLAIVADGLLLYFVEDAAPRLTLGLLALVPIVWAGSRLGVVDHAWDLVHQPRYPRRYLRLRSRVDELLGEIRRLNGIAVDAARGVREQDEAIAIMDGIEERLKELIGDIRTAAGVEARTEQDAPGHDRSSSESPRTSPADRELRGASA